MLKPGEEEVEEAVEEVTEEVVEEEVAAVEESSDNDVAADVRAAIEESAEEEEVEEKPGEGEEKPAALERGVDGKFKPKAEAERQAAPAARQGQTATAERLPSGWKPAARELLRKLPAEYKPIIEEALRRDTEVTNVLNETAEARRFHEEFKQRVGPFEAMIRSEGAEPAQAAENLFKAAYYLRTAPIENRAGFLAQMVLQHLPRGQDGLDGVRAIDQAFRQLLGDGRGAAPGARMPQEYRDPRVDRWIAESQRRRVESEQAELDGYKADLAKFSETHEFFGDVRETMAKLIEAGLAKEWQEAYDQACQMDKEIKGVLEGRAALERAKARKPSVARSKAAASSVRSTPAGTAQRRPKPRTDEEDDIAADIRAAIAENSSEVR